MDTNHPETVICHYRVNPGQAEAFEALLARHWRTLHELGLTTDAPPRFYRGLPAAKPGGPHGAEGLYVEIFEWRDAQAPNVAHQTPEVLAIWEPMGALCSDMDFPHFDPFEPGAAHPTGEPSQA